MSVTELPRRSDLTIDQRVDPKVVDPKGHELRTPREPVQSLSAAPVSKPAPKPKADPVDLLRDLGWRCASWLELPAPVQHKALLAPREVPVIGGSRTQEPAATPKAATPGSATPEAAVADTATPEVIRPVVKAAPKKAPTQALPAKREPAATRKPRANKAERVLRLWLISIWTLALIAWVFVFTGLQL